MATRRASAYLKEPVALAIAGDPVAARLRLIGFRGHRFNQLPSALAPWIVLPVIQWAAGGHPTRQRDYQVLCQPLQKGFVRISERVQSLFCFIFIRKTESRLGKSG